MQMETIIKYYFIPTSMTVIKAGKNKHGGKYGGGKIKRSTLNPASKINMKSWGLFLVGRG